MPQDQCYAECIFQVVDRHAFSFSAPEVPSDRHIKEERVRYGLLCGHVGDHMVDYPDENDRLKRATFPNHEGG